jgi:uncharacterized membrane protein
MTRRIVPVLDALTALVLLLLVWVLLTDGFTLALGRVRVPVTRGQDVLLVALALAAIRWIIAAPSIRPGRPARVVAIGVAVYTAVLSLICLGNHLTFRTHAMDLGYYVQVVWALGHGLTPYETLLEQHAWAGHLSPILYLMAPLGRLPWLPEALLVFQSLALALGAVPLYLMARPRVGDVAAAGLAVLYLLNPTLHGINTKDFHTAALAIPLLITAMYAVQTRRWWLFWPALALTLGTREDASIAVVGLGLWAAMAKRRFLLGGGVALIGIAWLFASVGWIMPHFRGEPYPYLTARYGHLGNSLGAIILSPILRPRAVLETLLSARRLRYVAALLAPLGFLPLAAPIAAVGALPALAQNLLNSDPILFNYRTQYQSFVLPFLVVASIAGLERVRAWSQGAVRPSRLGAMLTPRRVLTGAALVSLVLSDRTVNGLAVSRWRPTDDARTAVKVMDSIPPSASVCAGERFFPHLARRQKVFVFPVGLDRADYAFVSGARLDDGEVGRVVATRDGADVTLRPGAPVNKTVRFRIVREEGEYLLLQRSTGTN